jgi:hypothetical protein
MTDYKQQFKDQALEQGSFIAEDGIVNGDCIEAWSNAMKMKDGEGWVPGVGPDQGRGRWVPRHTYARTFLDAAKEIDRRSVVPDPRLQFDKAVEQVGRILGAEFVKWATNQRNRVYVNEKLSITWSPITGTPRAATTGPLESVLPMVIRDLRTEWQRAALRAGAEHLVDQKRGGAGKLDYGYGKF